MLLCKQQHCHLSIMRRTMHLTECAGGTHYAEHWSTNVVTSLYSNAVACATTLGLSDV